MEPDYLPCLLLQASIQSSSGQFDEAAKSFAKIVEVEPERKDAWIYLAISQLQNKRSKEALETLDKYNQMFPDDPAGQYYKGRGFIQM